MTPTIHPASPGEPIDEGVDRAINAALDAEEVLSPSEICHRSTWCAARHHPDTTPCLEKPRAAMDRTDFGPRRAVKVGWR